MKTKFLKICKRLASYSDHHQHKMAALVIRKNKILAMGFNTIKTHTKSPSFWKSQHAEFAAIKQLDHEQLNQATIFVYRVNKDGTLANAKPCESCMKLIIEKGIRKIYFTHEDGIKLLTY